MASALAVPVSQNRSREGHYRGVSEGTGLAAADMARVALAKESEQMQSCECCGLVEECTRSYIARIRASYCGRYVCGLCAEAVKEERGRLGSATMEEAISAHMNVCAQFNRAARADPLAQMATVAELMRQILRRSVEGGSPNSPKRPLRSRDWRSSTPPNLGRSASCIPLKSSLEIS